MRKPQFKKTLTLVLFIFASNLYALEIDEKLTLRFLKVSATKKTVLVNRGGEDGLVVGDHAKFFITAGVVARGVAEKVSPSRSIWSLYRVVDPNEITEDKVLNLKIATPVKITDDSSKSLKEEPIPSGTDTIADTEDSSGKEVIVTDSDKEELAALGIEDATTKSDAKTSAKPTKVISQDKKTEAPLELPSELADKHKSWEAWGTFYVNSLSGSVESTSASSSTEPTESSASTVDYSAGIEKYFFNYDNFMKEVSATVFIHKRTVENGDTISTSSDWFEYGVGASYHFYNSATSLNRLIGFGNFTLGKGSATLENKVITSESVEGSNSFYSIGAGTKYVLPNGFGIRASLDYYSSSETYDFADGTTKDRTLSGPRIQFGLSYRF